MWDMETELMLPASVILTNRLNNSSEAKDNFKVVQLYGHTWGNARHILGWWIDADCVCVPILLLRSLA